MLSNVQISTTTSAGEQAGLSGSPPRGDEHLSPLTANSGLFPLKEEEKESLHEDGSVFNITFYGHIEESSKENGDATVTINTNVQEINYHSNNRNEDKF